MLRHILWAILINGGLLLLFGYLGLLDVSINISTLLVGGIVLGIANGFIKPIIKILTIPIIFLTLGLFLLVINGIVLWLTSYILSILDFSAVYLHITSPGKFILATVLFSIVNFVVHHLVMPRHS